MVAVVLEHISVADALLGLAIALYFAAIGFLFISVLRAGRRLHQLAAIGVDAEP
jgi:hypothetical protein